MCKVILKHSESQLSISNVLVWQVSSNSVKSYILTAAIAGKQKISIQQECCYKKGRPHLCSRMVSIIFTLCKTEARRHWKRFTMTFQHNSQSAPKVPLTRQCICSVLIKHSIAIEGCSAKKSNRSIPFALPGGAMQKAQN